MAENIWFCLNIILNKNKSDAARGGRVLHVSLKKGGIYFHLHKFIFVLNRDCTHGEAYSVKVLAKSYAQN